MTEPSTTSAAPLSLRHSSIVSRSPRALFGAFVIAMNLAETVAQAQWQVAHPKPGQTFTRLAVGGDGRVAGAVVEGYGLMVSETGTSGWRSMNLPQFSSYADQVRDLIWANGRWVAASPNYLHSSTDLTHWSSSPHLGAQPSVVVWNGSRYWSFAAGGKAFSSIDTAVWTEEGPHNLKLPLLFDSVWFNSRFVVCGANGIASSTDGISWTLDALSPGYQVTDIESDGSVLLAAGTSTGGATTNLFRSSNGSQWTPVPVPPTPGGFPSIVHGGGKWLLLSYTGLIYRSVDAGNTWEAVGAVNGGPTSFTRSLGYRASDQRFFLGWINGSILSSTNAGTKWTEHQEGTLGSVTMVAHGGGRLVAVGSQGVIFTSADGSSWTSQSTGAADNPLSLRYLNGAFLAFSVSPQSILRSTDGVQFTRTSGGPPIRDALWNGSSYIGFDNTTNLYRSADGVAWSAIPGARHPATRTTTIGIGSFSYFDGRYLIFAQGFGGETRFFSSTDLASWTTNILQNVPNNDFSDFVQVGGKYFLSAQSALFSSQDGITWKGINYTSLPGETPQPAGTTLFHREGRLFTMQYLPGVPSFGQRLIASDDGTTWSLVTNSFPAPFFPQSKNRLIDTGTRLIAANFAGGLFAYDDIPLRGANLRPSRVTFEEWIATEGVPENLRGPQDDPDGDGFGNAAEFAYGTPASSAAGRPVFLASAMVIDGQSYASVALTRRKRLPAGTWRVDAANDLAFTSAVPAIEMPPTDLGNDLERVVYRTAAPVGTSQSWFLRIRTAAP